MGGRIRGEAFVVATIAAMIAASVSLTSPRQKVVSLAVAAALRAEIQWSADYLLPGEFFVPELDQPVCIDTESNVDFATLRESFRNTSVALFDGKNCPVRCEEGYERRVSPDGERAWLLSVTVGDCPNTKSCEIWVSQRGNGTEYLVKRVEGGWTAAGVINSYIANVGLGPACDPNA